MLVIDPDGGVSWGAHVGGIITGTILVLILRRRDVPLFDRTLVTPKAVRRDEAPRTPPETKMPPRWGRG